MEKTAAPARKRGIGLWIGAAAAAIVVLAAGGYYALVGDKRAAAPQVAAVSAPSAVDKAAQDAQLAAEAQRLKDQEELARLRTEAAAREKAEQEAAQRKQIEEETRRKIEAEMADKQRQQEDARQKAEADAAAKLRAEEDEKKAAEAAENGLRLPVLERQHLQVALTALGFRTAATDGNFSARTREMIAAWQKTHNDPPTGYLNGAQSQALLRDAAPAIARFDEEVKKLEERKKADEERAKAEASARAVPPPQPPPVAAPPSVASAAPRSGPDGVLARNHALHAVAERRRDHHSPVDQCLGRNRHLGSSRLGARDDGQPVRHHQDQRPAGLRRARLRAEQPAGCAANRDHAGAI